MRGTFSLGLRMKQLPQAMASGYIHMGTMAGKLKGVMPAQTPTGSRVAEPSMPAASSGRTSPLAIWPMPQASSTTSRPRRTSPLASSRVLPFSRQTISARPSAWASSSSR